MADFFRNVLNLNLLNLDAFTPRYVMKTAFEVMLQSAEVLKNVTPEGCNRLAWQEFQNKLQAFYLFEHVDSVLGLSADANLTLGEMVSKTRILGPFFSVWATEGLGHYYTYLITAGLLQSSGSIPKGLLSDTNSDLPRDSLVPLHTGMGLALAEALLARGYDTASLAENFLQVCRANARPEYWRASAEALGLVVRNLHPGLIPSLDQYFLQTDEEMLACFWHGVGRGIYFTPPNFLPYWSEPWQGYEMCMREPPHEVGRRNAVAGFAWAMTLVNLRQPEIVAGFLERYGRFLAARDAFANGVFSALVVWLHCAPHDTSVRGFLDYQPDLSNHELGHLWEAQVRRAGQAALQFFSTHPDVKMGELFRYHPVF